MLAFKNRNTVDLENFDVKKFRIAHTFMKLKKHDIFYHEIFTVQ